MHFLCAQKTTALLLLTFSLGHTVVAKPFRSSSAENLLIRQAPQQAASETQRQPYSSYPTPDPVICNNNIYVGLDVCQQHCINVGICKNIQDIVGYDEIWDGARGYNPDDFSCVCP